MGRWLGGETAKEQVGCGKPCQHRAGQSWVLGKQTTSISFIHSLIQILIGPHHLPGPAELTLHKPSLLSQGPGLCSYPPPKRPAPRLEARQPLPRSWGEIGFSPAASFYKTSTPQGPGCQAHVLSTMPHPDHHPCPRATPGREGTAGGEGWPWRVWRCGARLGAGHQVNRKGCGAAGEGG